MTTEEKLKHFLDSCILDARDRSEKMLSDYESALEKTFIEHQADAKRRQQMQLKMESDKISREMNKELAVKSIELRKLLGKKQEELKDMLFVELKDMLEKFMDTPEYHDLLEAQINHAFNFAGDDEIKIYLDPVDENQLRRLNLHHGNLNIMLSEYSFMGGTRAVISSKNVLIDNSFMTKLEEAKADFHFDLGGMTNE